MEQQANGSRASDDRRHAGTTYTSSDELLRNVGGSKGPEARAIANGYMMAIRDADADCLSASTLLDYLRCDIGSVLELTGLGYVKAVRDCMEPAGGADARERPSCELERMRSDAVHVRSWLERRPGSVIQPAIALVQLALWGPAHAVSARARVVRGPLAISRWLGSLSGAAKGLAAVAVALAVVVALQPVPRSDNESRIARVDLIVSRDADNVMAMLLEQRRYEKDSILNLSDPVQSEAYAQKWKEARLALMSSLDAMGSLDLADEDRQSLAQMRDDLHFYELGYLQLLSQMQRGQVRTPQDANRLLEEYKPAAHRVEANGVRIAARALRRAQLQ